MTITEKEIKEIINYVELADAFTPLLATVVDKLISNVGPELGRLANEVVDGIAARRIRFVQAFIDAGFNRDEAILMTMDEVFAMKRAFSGKSFNNSLSTVTKKTKV